MNNNRKTYIPKILYSGLTKPIFRIENKMLKKEYEILEPFAKQPWKNFTFKDIKHLSNKKSESYVYSSLNKFVKNQILKKSKIGNVAQYKLNLESLKTISYLGMVSEYIAWHQKHLPYNLIEEVNKKIPIGFYSLIITGSYASKKQKKDSDIDLVIIIEDKINPEKVYAELSHYSEMSIPKIHLYIFRRSEMLNMLSNKESNYGKEIVHNNFLIFGAESYFKIVLEAIRNGFNG